MKNILLFIKGTLICSSLNAQDILWEKSYGGKHADYLLDAQPTADYGFILAGASLSKKTGNKTEDNQGNLDYWIWKMDEEGNEDWQKNFGGSGADILYSIKNTHDGGFILAGTSDSSVSGCKKDLCRGREDIWILKLNAKGSEEWQRTIGGPGQDLVKNIAQTIDGGYIVGGSSSSDISPEILKGGIDKYGKNEKNRGNLDYWIIKLDEVGEVEWQKTLGGNYVDRLESIQQTKDGGYIVGGYSNSPGSYDKEFEGYGDGDYWIIKLNKRGDTQWQKVLGGEQDDHIAAIIQLKEGGYIAGGNSISQTSGNKTKYNKQGTDFWVIKLDEKGGVLWQETYNTSHTDILTSLVENDDGTLLLGGYAQSEIFGDTKRKTDKKDINDYIALKISADGEEIWKGVVGSKGEDILKRLTETRDGGYLLSGTSKGEISRDRNSAKGQQDFWVVKLEDKEKKKNEEKVIIEAIPNPARPFTNIIVGFEFTSGTASVFDLSGKLLQTLDVDSRTIPLDFTDYPTGVYIVEVKTDAGTSSVKVLKANH
ncbi:T9SS type A sorting domain-containing protein [Flavobacterium rhizosphaerae]|uniref:T9SS type A sorting domain-containing protein n=1 Tax=Flavobacterium rhizosphaerae TaxID=3163298 RepID=A0ABW8YYY5_9FLAO